MMISMNMCDDGWTLTHGWAINVCTINSNHPMKYVYKYNSEYRNVCESEKYIDAEDDVHERQVYMI